MKKSLRVLSLILAILMISGSMSVLGSAFDMKQESQGYYNDVDTVELSIDQYARICMDEIDRMLAEADLKVEVLSLSFDFSSVQSVLSEASGLVNSASGILGSAGTLVNDLAAKLALLSTVNRNMNETQMPVFDASYSASDFAADAGHCGEYYMFLSVLDLLGCLSPVVEAYTTDGGVNDTTLGFLYSLAAPYIFNLKELAYSALISVTEMYTSPTFKDKNGEPEDWDIIDDLPNVAAYYPQYLSTNGGALTFVTDLLKKIVLGDWTHITPDMWYQRGVAGKSGSSVVFDEYYWKDRNGNPISNPVYDPDSYDYYGYVHPEKWVTFGLGDAYMVAKGTGDPTGGAGSFKAVDLAEAKRKVNAAGSDYTTYDFIEELMRQAYNGIAVPVLNRITVRWLREEAGFEMLDSKTSEWLREEVYDEDGKLIGKRDKVDPVTGEKIPNPEYDYCYKGEDYLAEGADENSIILQVFDVANPDSIKLPRVTVPDGYTFIEYLNTVALGFVNEVLVEKYHPNGTAPIVEGDVDYGTWSWTLGTTPTNNNDTLLSNVCQLAKMVLMLTGDSFFSGYSVARGEVKSVDQIKAMYSGSADDGNQKLLAYIIRAICNDSIDWMYVPEIAGKTDTIAGAGYEALLQLAYQDLPQFTYKTFAEANTSTDDLIDNALTILMDIGAYNLNQGLDVNLLNNGATGTTNNGTTNNTGLLGYSGNNRAKSYKNQLVTLGVWAINKFGKLLNCNYQLLNGTAAQTEPNYSESGKTADMFWHDIDEIIDHIIPLKAANNNNRPGLPWIQEAVSSQTYVVKSILIDFLVKPILTLDSGKLFSLMKKSANGSTAFDSYNIERIIVELLHNIFDLIFPGVFDHGMVDLDSVLNNSALGLMVSKLLKCLTAHWTYNGSGIGSTLGRGKIIANVAFPVVAMILGFIDEQEFGEVENYLPEKLTAGQTSFRLYNGSEGMNSRYVNNSQAVIDNLYTYVLQGVTAKSVATGAGITVSGANANTEIKAGEYITPSFTAPKGLISVTTNYKVKTEDGSYLTSDGAAYSAAANNAFTLQDTVYSYVLDTGEVEYDNKEMTASLAGGTLKYKSDYFFTGGLDKIGDISIEFEDAKDDAAKSISLQSVSVAKTGGAAQTFVIKDAEEAPIAANGKGTTYTFKPFDIADTYSRKAYTYQKATDEEGNPTEADFVDENTGLKVRTGLKPTEEGKTVNYVDDGCYTITATFTNGSATANATFYVHFYDDFGLSRLFDTAVGANRSVDTVEGTTGQSMLNAYNTKVGEVAALVLQPKTSTGTAFETFIGLGTSGANYLNKYEKLYAELYSQIKAISAYDKKMGSATIRESLAAKSGYDYKIVTETINGKQYKMREPIEYWNAGTSGNEDYKFFGIRDVVAHTFNKYRLARNYAQDLVNRDVKFINDHITQADYDEMTPADQAKWDANFASYEAQVEAAGIIKPSEYAIAVHRLNTTYNRLRWLNGDVSKLTMMKNMTVDGKAIYNLDNTVLGQYTAKSAEAYANARDFMGRTIQDGTSARPSAVQTAIEKLVYAYKHLTKAADITKLATAVSNAEAWLQNTALSGAGVTVYNPMTGYVNVAETSTLYTDESFQALLNLVRQGEELVKEEQEVGRQQSLDELADRIDAARQPKAEGSDIGLVEKGASAATIVFNPAVEFACGDDLSFHADINYDPEIITGKKVSVNGEEYDLDGFMLGIEPQTDNETVLEAFECTGCVLQNVTEKEKVGTGSVFVVRQGDENGPIIKTFVLVIRSDNSGDGKSNATDKTNLIKEIAVGNYGGSEDPLEYAKFIGCDLDGSGKINTTDKTNLVKSQSGGYDIWQPTGSGAKVIGLYNEDLLEA